CELLLGLGCREVVALVIGGGIGRMSRFTPATPRSRRLGCELRKLHDARSLTVNRVVKELRCSQSRVSRIESGEIKARPGEVMGLLIAYDIPIDSESGQTLIALARGT
ncbi:MAG TPA: helix-turn-helix transcriptional regulator, partial [Micromonosporaceae bacterium]|nr:helix-turn-helix transcriptional regulator [Micromonosporaceae bacterium]